MKEYPRIHSIGAINIIHHQNFDYELHPFRTDFTGDSGVGKSILTDLLQLIIIGSTEYESSTHSQDDRPFNTLVLETSEKGDFGYAYLNVEVEKEQYLLIGCYIERKSKQSQAFIVQGGLDFDQKTFEPFYKPFTVEDFVDNDTLLTLIDFDNKMSESDHFGCHIYQYFKDYHEALLNNNLLPIDIASSKSDLRDYAKILQAFSRKGISVKNDVQLQGFLFGEEKNQIFYNKYLETVKHFEDSVETHRKNKEEIEALTAKAHSINVLYKLKKQKDSAQKEFVEVDWNYKSSVLEATQKAIKTLLGHYLDARAVIDSLSTLKTNKLKQTQESISTIQPEFDKLSKELKTLEQRTNLINSCRTIKKELSLNSDEELKALVDEYRKKQNLDIALETLTEALKKENLVSTFEKLDFSDGLELIISNQNKDIKRLNEELSLSKELVKFNDFNNPDTLSYWILKQNKACTKIEESVLRHFHDLKTVLPELPEAGDRYIPDPQQLILALKEEKVRKEKEGFWIDLSGLYIFIDYVDQIFDTNDHKKIKAFLIESNNQIQAEIHQTNNDLEKLKKLQSFLLNQLPKIPNAIAAWLSKDEDGLNDEIAEAVDILTKEDIEQIFKDIKIENELLNQLSSKEERKKALGDALQVLVSIEKQLPEVTVEALPPIEETIENQIRNADVSKEQKARKFSFEDSLYAVEFKTEYLKQKTALSEIDKLEALLEQKTNAENRILEIETVHSEWLQSFTSIKVEQADYDNSKNKYDGYSKEYSDQFDGMIIGYKLTDKADHFETDKNFMELVRLLLPHQLFKDISFDEAAVIPKIIEYLDEINEENARLNQNKLISIRDLLQDLQSTIKKQVSHSKKMNTFFQKDYMEITGENTASLKADLRKDFSLQWISTFLTNLGKFDFGLFDRDNSLTSKLKDAPTLKEKIILAYKEHSETPLPNVTIRQLLNPFSYYNLNYELVTKSGKKNSGSTGQTYSSIALLCIAKLSLIKDGKVNKSPGLRFLSIDEAEGIGSNFDMLKELAEKFDYQVISLGINPNKLSRKNQYIYRLSKQKDYEHINHHPSVIFCEL